MRPVRVLVVGAAFIMLMTHVTTVAGAKNFTDWSEASEVANVDAPEADGCPIESPDGNELYIASRRGEGDDNDIWVASRPDKDAEFSAPTMLPAPVNSDAEDFCPTPLRGKFLLFVSTRGGVDAYGTAACGAGDIYLTRRSPATGSWDAPRNLGCAPDGPNQAGAEFGPSLVETDAGTVLFYSSGGAPGSNTQDVYMSWQQPDGSFGPPELVDGLNTEGHDDMMPNVSKDGREVVLASNRPGGSGSFDIWTATRESVFDSWSTPVNLGAVNTAGSETRPSLSWDGERLYLGRDGVIFVSHRAKVTGKP